MAVRVPLVKNPPPSALGKVQTNLTLKTTSKVDVHDVGSIQNRFGTVTIRANVSQNGVVTNSSADCSGLGVAPDVHNQATIELNSDVSIRNVQVIEGRYVYINAVLKKLDVYSYGYAKGSGLGANIDAMNDLTVSLTANTRVEGVTVIGHDGAVINAEVIFAVVVITSFSPALAQMLRLP